MSLVEFGDGTRHLRVASGWRAAATGVGPPRPVRRAQHGDSGVWVTERGGRTPPRRQDPPVARAVAEFHETH